MNVFSVGWLYAWRWIAAMLLGGFSGVNIALLFTASVPFLPGTLNVVFGVALIIAFSVLYHLERQAGIQQNKR